MARPGPGKSRRILRVLARVPVAGKYFNPENDFTTGAVVHHVAVVHIGIREKLNI